MRELLRQPERHPVDADCAIDRDREASGDLRNYITPRGLTALRERLDQTRRPLAAIDPATKGVTFVWMTQTRSGP